MFIFYSLFITLMFVGTLFPLIIGNTKYLAGFWQRLGYLPEFNAEGKSVIWLHCVSVGETQAARPLITKLIKNFPNHKFVISTTTKTGQELAREVFQDKVDLVFYFPYDWKFSVRRSLRKINPNLILFMESEIWFNFIHEAAESGAKMAIVSGRFSEKSAGRFNRFKLVEKTLRQVFSHIDLALMQTSADAERITAFGVDETKTKVLGSIKYDQEISLADSQLTEKFQERFNITKETSLIIAASTHAPEEKLILEAFRILQENSPDFLARLVLVPRHPEKISRVIKSIKKTKFRWVKRSEKPAVRDKTAEVILLDTIGELRSIYPLAEIVFVGGSLIPHGGQNVLEPAIVKKAIVTGYYTKNFKAIIEDFLDSEALIQMPKLKKNEVPQKLADEFLKLLKDEKKRSELGENALSVVNKKRGVTFKTVESLKALLNDNIIEN